MPRFVILRHDMPPGAERSLHWDLMLEECGALRTWALDTRPVAGLEIDAAALADHRIEYLGYEGPISGGRGTVSREEFGTFQVESETETEMKRSGEWAVLLMGQRLCGRVVFKRIETPEQRWRITFFGG